MGMVRCPYVGSTAVSVQNSLLQVLANLPFIHEECPVESKDGLKALVDCLVAYRDVGLVMAREIIDIGLWFVGLSKINRVLFRFGSCYEYAFADSVWASF